jgi:hypothetical protein
VTRDFVVWSYYGYFALFLLVEFVFTRFRLGSGGQGNRDPLSFLFFFLAPFVGMFVWMTLLNRGIVPANPFWPQWFLGCAIGFPGVMMEESLRQGKWEGLLTRVRKNGQRWWTPHLRADPPSALPGIIQPSAAIEYLEEPGKLLVPTHLAEQEWLRGTAIHLEGLGQRYRDYMARTKRLIPGVW